MKAVFVGLGSNIGDREANIRQALDQLQTDDLRLLRLSSLYETEPMGLREQPWFLNQVAEFETGLAPHQLLERTRRIEDALGRKREVTNGPRTIDIDILLHGDAIVNTPELTVPHPRYRERRFVLEPLLELNSTLKDPETGLAVSEMLNGVQDQAVRRRQ